VSHWKSVIRKRHNSAFFGLFCRWFIVVAPLALPLTGAAVQAALPAGVTVEVAPIVGYERVQKQVPDSHYGLRLLYGARFTAGYRILSAEGELTRGDDEELFPSIGMTTRDLTDKARLGLRTQAQVVGPLEIVGRGGAQASRNHHEETVVGGTTSVSEEPISVSPYVGAGLRLSVSPRISGSAELVVVIPDYRDLSRNEYQLTGGFAFSLL